MSRQPQDNSFAQVRRLIELAQHALQLGLLDPAQLLVEVDAYLQEFELWQGNIAQVNPLGPTSSFSDNEKVQFRNELLELEQVHQELVTRAESCRDQIRSDITEIRKRTQGLKAYIDRYPSRITIAGKREG